MMPSAAAALSQAMAAMHSLRSMQQARNSLLVNAAHPHSQLLATQVNSEIRIRIRINGINGIFLQAALLQGQNAHPAVLLNGTLNKTVGNPVGVTVGGNNLNAAGNGQDIDLSLPITSTYLRRMRAFGLASGFDQAYRQHHGIEVIQIITILFGL